MEKKVHTAIGESMTGNFHQISADLFPMKSLVGASRLQVELGVALLQLLNAAVNKTGWETKKHDTNRKHLSYGSSDTILGEIPLAAWV